MERLRSRLPRLAGAATSAPPPSSRSTFSAWSPQSSPPCHSSARSFGASVALANAPTDADVQLRRRSQHRQLNVEPLWSPAAATRGNRWQTARPLKRPRRAKTVAVGCDRLPESFHGKEGVGGSSPPEGFAKAPQNGAFSVTRLAESSACGGYGALYGAFRLRARAPIPRKSTHWMTNRNGRIWSSLSLVRGVPFRGVRSS
jgi:hypothetical protein